MEGPPYSCLSIARLPSGSRALNWHLETIYRWRPKLYVRYHGNRICGRGYQLPLISIILIIENISSKSEQKTTVARYQTHCTNSTEGSIHGSIWKNLQPLTVFPVVANISWMKQWCCFCSVHSVSPLSNIYYLVIYIYIYIYIRTRNGYSAFSS